MKAHVWELVVRDRPYLGKTRIELQCAECGSHAKVFIPIGSNRRARTRARREIQKAISRSFPPDCEDVARLGVCHQIHES